ncbi:hypothetical protein V6N11_082046 [Hibiscus sabdariffa]|uniref:Uncharacterized protein n=1 Tax=Hibiscus sabdariffa TaxID=183260 RepID=A0ABR2QGW4_9ROSI
MPIADHVVSFPVKSEEAIDGRGITGLFGSMFGKLSSLERIDRQAALHAVTIKEIRVEISESSPLHPYISSLSLAKKEVGKSDLQACYRTDSETGTGIASGHSIVSELGFLSVEKERDEESSDPSH